MTPKFPKFRQYKDYEDWYVMKIKGCEINLFFTKSGKIKEYSIFTNFSKMNANILINSWRRNKYQKSMVKKIVEII